MDSENSALPGINFIVKYIQIENSCSLIFHNITIFTVFMIK